ncbi:hypothetical protein CD30_16000 [Ureibacillus massiliensis 4400831 = CIP 108448 = CCUG 49529]|uniref:Uncharacterized protein n=1 Tax=Ureibacillus massiliensis 4400831 = CIP 108448 = CCUG 49529 TaxID=1211035 RepID=A0A0A3J1R6_9BACL|nr:hypothetical protein [Ureibacillus massiliensis]KGR89655.1 hypothetical protein CD30_16000 [Ureibacillus massiliensis 4400831 = CIP 108448 = CCUG 49529]BDH60936.1 hypothetical protein MTP04_10660 [Lysinibacillus sp. PLM2]
MENNSEPSKVGYTIFKPTGVRHEFPKVDLVNQQVTCTVLYKEETYMTVIIDLKHDKVQVQGEIDELGDLSMDKDSYIDMFKHWAKFFIDNDISNPSDYFDELMKTQS